MNRVCSILGIEKPVIQGPMAWISTAPLVSAVSNAGGLGVLGVGFAPEGFIREQIRLQGWMKNCAETISRSGMRQDARL